MKKFLVLYKAPIASYQAMMKSTPEQQKPFTDAWMAWSKNPGPGYVDVGSALGKSLKVTPAGASPTVNDLGGYSIMQGESKEAVAESLKGHPHFMMPESFIEVIELFVVPGM